MHVQGMIMMGVAVVLVVGILAARWSVQRRREKKKPGG